MALTAAGVEAMTHPASIPLSTGFTYRNREDVPGFEISAELQEAAANRMKQFEAMRSFPGRYLGLGAAPIESTDE